MSDIEFWRQVYIAAVQAGASVPKHVADAALRDLRELLGRA